MGQKPKHPKEMGNGQFKSEGGLELYTIVFGLIGRVGRLEGGFVIVIVLLTAILGLLGVILERLG